mmetsp:Transcript_11649/g.23888  ORF Transcript_11649/g.23888 Transcript_11649/m.23888 type:complete len:99 (-) Transcript_11649:2148-2444(-)
MVHSFRPRRILLIVRFVGFLGTLSGHSFFKRNRLNHAASFQEDEACHYAKHGSSVSLETVPLIFYRTSMASEKLENRSPLRQNRSSKHARIEPWQVWF